MIKKVYQIANMHCSGCAFTLESIEDELHGIHRIAASFRKQQLEVEYDEDLLQEEQILKAIQEKGYEAKCIATMKS